MAKLLIAACAALFLLSAIVANPLNHKQITTASKHLDCKDTMKQIINNLKDIKIMLSKNTLSYFVPKVITDEKEKNQTIEEIACRGVKALNLPNPYQHIDGSLNRSLALFSKGVDCKDTDEKYDFQTFIEELLSEFQKHYPKHCFLYPRKRNV